MSKMNQSMNRGLRAACAAAAMATAWGGSMDSAQGQVVIAGAEVQTNFTTPLDNAYLIYGINTSGLYEPIALSLGTISSGAQNIAVFLETSEGVPIEDLIWTVLGTYEGAGEEEEESVSVSMLDDAAADAIGNAHTWDIRFGSYTESEIYTALVTGDTSTLLDFVSINQYDLFAPFDTPNTQVNFSEASPNGSSVLTIPEPTSVVLLTLSGLVVAVRRRRA